MRTSGFGRINGWAISLLVNSILLSITLQERSIFSLQRFSIPFLQISLFRCGLVGNNLVSWYNLVARIAQVRLNDRGDVFKWGLLQSGIFSVHSMYSALICNGHVRQNRTLWKTRIPLKIKIFMWYLHRGVVLTKDNLAKLNWHGSKKMCVLFT